MQWHPIPDLPGDLTAPMQQHVHYARTCQIMGSQVQSYVAGSPAQPRAYAQILHRRLPVIGHVAQLARGPVWPHPISLDEAAEGLNGLVGDLKRINRAVIVINEPLAGADFANATKLLPLFTGATHAYLNLDGTSKDRMLRQHGKWRNRLRRAQDNGLKVDQSGMPGDTEHWLLDREVQQSKEMGYRALPPEFTIAWRQANGPKSTRLYVARHKGDPVAAMLFLCHGKAATYHIGWSNQAGRDLHAHNLLLWTASEWFAKLGFGWIDLGLIDTETRPSLARFKIGSGATAHPLGATYLSAIGTHAIRSLTRLTEFRSRQSQQVRG
ncbi:MAG: GNAT family N-acetyltransferase [Paracoccaceae bacterium]